MPFVALVASLVLPPLAATDELTIRSIMSGQYGTAVPPFAGWAPDGKRWLSVEDGSVAAIDAATGRKETLVAKKSLVTPDRRPISPEGVQLSEDGRRLLLFTNSRRVWRRNTHGDYWVVDLASGKLTRIAPDAAPSTTMFAKLSPDGTRVGYVRANDLYVQDLDTGRTTRLTNDGGETRINGTSDWVYEEELDVRDAWRWSPDGKRVAYWQFDTHEEPLYTLVDDTSGLYPTLRRFPYPKVGQKNASVRIGVVSAGGGATTWMAPTVDGESGYLARMGWAGDSGSLLIQRLNRKQNEDDFLLADATTGAARSIFKDTDATWVEVGSNSTGEEGARWIDNGRAFLTLSERDGWRHLYRVPRDGGTPTLLTPGDFDVADVQGVDEGRGAVYFRASPGSAVSRDLYRCDLRNGAAPVRVTPADVEGTVECLLSPDARWALSSRSRLDAPPIFEVVSLPNGKVVRTVETNEALRAKLKALKLGSTQFLTLRAADGEPMDARLTLPPGFDPKKRYPVLFQVYGEPAGTTVADAWGGEDFLFHQRLAREGYLIASVDNRGTPSLKGRAWRKAVYRKIGVVASDDQAAAARQLSKLPYVDGSRMAVWGWSGGGSMTLNLMFRHPEIYKVGMAVASVPDMRLYDTIYQERYMGLLAENAKDYEAGSPITHAEGLQGDLLIVHGTGDDNVHYQGDERLIDRLVELGKPFQMMAYPNRSHGIDEGPGTTVHLYELLERFLTTHLPAGGR